MATAPQHNILSLNTCSCSLQTVPNVVVLLHGHARRCYPGPEVWGRAVPRWDRTLGDIVPPLGDHPSVSPSGEECMMNAGIHGGAEHLQESRGTVLLAPCATRQSHGVMPSEHQGAPPKAPGVTFAPTCNLSYAHTVPGCSSCRWGVTVSQPGDGCAPPPHTHTAQLRFRFAQGWFQVSELLFAHWAPAGTAGPQGCRGVRGGGKVLCSGQDVVEEGVGRRAVLYGDLRVPVGCRAVLPGG